MKEGRRENNAVRKAWKHIANFIAAEARNRVHKAPARATWNQFTHASIRSRLKRHKASEKKNKNIFILSRSIYSTKSIKTSNAIFFSTSPNSTLLHKKWKLNVGKAQQRHRLPHNDRLQSNRELEQQRRTSGEIIYVTWAQRFLRLDCERKLFSCDDVNLQVKSGNQKTLVWSHIAQALRLPISIQLLRVENCDCFHATFWHHSRASCLTDISLSAPRSVFPSPYQRRNYF